MRLGSAVLLAVMIAWTLPAGLALGQTAAGVKVIVNGVEISLPAPAVLSSGQVMAPISGLFEPMGAVAAYYEADRSIVVSNRVRTTVRMRLGDPTLYVNTTARPLVVAPLMQGQHVFIPAQAVFAALGAWTKYEETDRTLYVSSQIRSIVTQASGDLLQVRVDATGPMRVETNVLSKPDRMVVDFLHAALRTQERVIPLNSAGVTRIRTAQFQVKPYISRMVFDLAQPVEVRVITSGTSYLVTLEVRPKDPVIVSRLRPPAPTLGERDPNQASAKISGVTFQELGQTGRLFIDGNGTMEYRVREFVYPDRLVIDIADAVFIPVKQEIPVDGTSIVSVRAAQFSAEPPVARIVVTLKRKMNYIVSQSDGRLAIEINAFTARGHIVALDAGHGGRDPGAIGPTGLRESDAVLDITLRARELLQRDGIRVWMVRETDATVDLADRTRLAREAGATILVSIHANAHTRTAVNGSETYYSTPQSLALAQMIQDELGVVLGIPSRGVKTANFLVLRDSGIPSVLVETTFISHPDEETRLRDSTFRQRIAQAIYKGITRFLAIYPTPVAP
jgi:N-acetylmuramoyl-L-alanine amidase